jgi:TP901 family phage tail tape measure protein
MQRSQVINRMAKNALTMQQQIGKIQSVASKNGKIRLQHEQAIDRILLHQTNIRNRIANLDIRREAIARAESNLEVKRIRILQQELGIESQLEKIELRRAGIMNQVGRIGTTQLRNQQQVDTLRRTAHALETQEIQREMQVRKAESARMRGVSKKVSGRSMQNLMDAELIARRRLTETQMARAELPGQGRILASVGDDLKRNIVQTKGQLGELRIAEQKAELASQALAETVRGLEHQLAGLQARSAAVAGTEVELNKAIELTARDLQIANVEWAKQVKVAEQAAIALGHNIETQKMYNQQLMEFNALSAAQSGEKIATVARTASHIGRVLTATGLIGVAAFGAMAIAAAKFNSQAVNVATQTGNINQSAQAVVNNAAKIQTAVLKTMQTVPASSTDLTDALYNIYSSMQVTFGGGTKLLKLFGDVWVAGGMRGSIQDVSDALITLANNWQISGDNMKGFQKLAASTLATVRFGRLTVDQYTQTMNQLAPAFHGAHQSIEQMNGALAFLSRLLPSTGVTAAGIARMMEQFQRFAANPKAGFENLAKEITGTSGNLKPLNEVLQILINRMPDLAKSGVTLTNFFKTVSGNQGTVQARRALQGFILQFPEYQRVLKATTADQKELERSRKAMQESPGVKWATFMTQMHALALELGASVIPMLLAAIKPIQYIARGFDNLSDAQKRNIGHWAAWIAIGTLAAGVIASIAGGFALFIISMKTLKGAIGGGAGLKALGVEAGFVSARMGILGAALTALTLLFVQNPGLVKRMTDALGGLHTILKVLSALATVWTIQTIINSFLMMGNQAKIARGEIAATRVALLGLNGLTVGVIIAVSILQTPQYKKCLIQ